MKYAVITPFEGQENNWSDDKKEKYEEILMMADYHASITKRTYEGPWQFVEKNKFLIRNTDGLLLIYDDEKEGSPKYIKEMAEKYAESNEYEIIKINFYDLQLIAEEEQLKEWE